MVTAIDFETFYDKDYSVSGSHPRTYCLDSRFDPYLVALVREDGARWIGRPEDCPGWDDLDGDTFIAHNASFDYEVFVRCQELGLIPAHIKPKEWFCTADLSRYHQGPRTLAGAMWAFFKKVRDKNLRNVEMKGKHWQDIVDAGLGQAVLDYGYDDADDCLALWNLLSEEWPEKERKLSKMSREMGSRGPAVNEPALVAGMKIYEQAIFNAENSLPWTAEWDAKYKKNYSPQSKRGLHVACQSAGIPTPTSTAKDSEEYLLWQEKYGKSFAWVESMAIQASTNTHLNSLKTIHKRIRPDGTIPYGLKYGGADTTMRFSGDSGFNTQNMPRDPHLGVSVRNMFVPRNGYKFVICDLSQIEPRCLAWGAGDVDTLELLSQGMSPYEVHARKSMQYDEDIPLKKFDPNLYNLAKARVLSLGYGASWQTFIRQAQTYGAEYIFDEPITDENKWAFLEYVEKYSSLDVVFTVKNFDEDKMRVAVNAWNQVMDFRQTNPLIKDFWYNCHADLKEACHKHNGSELNFTLPSGRVMRYFQLRREDKNITGFTQLPEGPKWNKRRKIYGAMLVENFCQGFGRDVFTDHLLTVSDHVGRLPVFQVHDEIVIEVPDASAEDLREEIESLMSTPVEWAEGLPVAAEAIIADFYTK
jgi:hypothetical protein